MYYKGKSEIKIKVTRRRELLEVFWRRRLGTGTRFYKFTQIRQSFSSSDDDAAVIGYSSYVLDSNRVHGNRSHKLIFVTKTCFLLRESL
jgi:hypothetical protein